MSSAAEKVSFFCVFLCVSPHRFLGGGVFHTVVVSVHSSFYAWEGQPPFQDNASSLAAWRTEHDLVNLPRQHIHTYTHKLTFLLFIFIVGLYVYADRLNFSRIWLTLCYIQSEYSSAAAGSSMSTTHERGCGQKYIHGSTYRLS